MTRRAASLLAEDVDALEEAWEKAGLRGTQRTVKVQAPGPITLAAQLELGNGHRAITDPGAVRDLAGSLAEGVAVHRAEVARRLDCTVVVQFDEPSLPAALVGRLTGVTGLSPVHPVDESVAAALLDDCASTVGGEVAMHSCAPGLPWPMLQRGKISAVSFDLSTLTADDLDGIGEFVESGRTVMLGVVPATAPDRPPSAEEVARSVVAIHRPTRLPPRRAARTDRRHTHMRRRRRDPAVGPHRDRTHPESVRSHRRRPRRDLEIAFAGQRYVRQCMRGTLGPHNPSWSGKGSWRSRLFAWRRERAWSQRLC